MGTSDIAIAQEAIKDLEACQQKNRALNPKALKLIRRGKDYGLALTLAFSQAPVLILDKFKLKL